MSQPTLSAEQYDELEAQLGRLNGQFTRDPLSEYTGNGIHGLLVTDPNYGTISYSARFPCRKSTRMGLRRYETSGDVLHHTVLETGWMAGSKLGCQSPNGLTVFLPQYPGGPQQFAQAIQSVTRIKITWHFVARALVDATPVFGPGSYQLAAPAKNNANPPDLLVHQSDLVQLRKKGEATFGTGQRIDTRVANLVSMYNPSVRVRVGVLQAEAMDGWFRYQVSRP